jgi:gliding motility-associated-like protein
MKKYTHHLLSLFLLLSWLPISAQQKKNIVITDAGTLLNIDSLNNYYQTAHLGPQLPSLNACPSTNNLATPMNQNNGQRGIMFDITAITCVTIRCFEGNFATGTTGVQIWYRPGTHVGFANSSIGWTLLGTANAVVGAGNNLFTAIPIPINVTINAGATAAFYITRTTAGGPLVNYTNGTALGNVYSSDANIQVKDGTGKDFSFGASFSPRRFNGRIFYDVGSTVVNVGAVVGTTPACSGTQQTFSVAPVAGATTYNWTVPAGSSIVGGVGTNSITVNMGTNSGNVCVAPVVPCGIVTPSCFSVTVVSNQTVIPTASPASVCSGNSSQLNVPTGTTFSWSPAVGLSCTNCANPIATPTATTTYTVTTNTSGCIGTGTTTVNVLQNPTPLANNTGPFCAGSTINLSASGGTTYSWSGPGGFGSLNQNPAIPSSATTMSGTYTVIATVGTCTASTTTSVTVNALPNVSVNSTAICNGQATATLTANGALNFTWSPGASSTGGPSVTASPTVTTQYTVTGTDGNNCSSSAVSTVTVNILPPVTVNSPSICPGATATLNASGALNYTWSPGTSSSGGPSVTATPTVTTQYTVTGIDGNNCTNTATATVTINTLPTVSVNSPSVCPGSPATLNASGATTYNWSPGTSSATGQSVTASPAITTQYTVTGTDNNNCTDTAIATVTIYPALVISAGADDTVCLGASIPLNAIGATGVSFTWNPGSLSGASQSPIASSTQTYTLSGIDQNGCSGTDSVLITVPPQFTLNAAGFTASCNGTCDGQAVVIPSPNTGPFAQYTYVWSNNATTPSALNLCAGNYTVDVSDAAGCVNSASVIVNQPSSIVANSSNVTPASCNTSCDGSALITANGGTGALNFNWSSGATGSNPTTFCAGSYTCTVSDANGCSVTVPVVITQPSAISVTIPSVNTICIGQSANLTANANGGNGGYVYTWTGGTTPNNSISVSATPTVTSTYTVSVSDVNNCPAGTATVAVTVSAPLSVLANTLNPSICAGASTNLSASANGGNGQYSYSWSGGTTPNIGSVVSGSPNSNTTYTVTVSDGCGTPPASTTVQVNVNPLPVLSISSSQTSGCAPMCVSFTLNSNPPASVVNWTSSLGQTATGAPANFCFNAQGNFGATVNVTDVNGCQNTFTNNNLLTLYSVPLAEFSYSPDSPSDVNPLVSFTDNSIGNGINSWDWNFGTGASNFQNPQFEFPGAGTYTVTLTVSTQSGCIDSVAHIIEVKSDFSFYVPNAFTPNGDGLNETFYPQGFGFSEEGYQFSIFDRWGNLVWSTNKVGDFWDGVASGGTELVQQDVYVWKVTLKQMDGTKRNYLGHVSVVR